MSYDPYQSSQGAPQPQGAYPAAAPYAPPMPVSTNGFAIASLICSLLGVSLLGVIFGHVALSQIAKSNGAAGGRGLAIAGLIIGYIGLAIAVVVVAFIVILTIAAAGASTH